MDTVQSIPKYQIRGINLHGFSKIAVFLNYIFPNNTTVRNGMLIAINAEKVLIYESNRLLRKLIDSAEIKYADGASIVRAIQKKYPQAKVARIAGVDLWKELMIRAGKYGIPVFLIGGKSKVMKEIVEKLQRQWNVNIVGMQHGYFDQSECKTLFDRVAMSGAQIVTVAMGSPKQELLIQDCKSVWPQALYMGVGGAYDIFTGYAKRAPIFWQQAGLEWFYRLLTQPDRFLRQLRLIKFLGYYYRCQL